MIASVLAVTFIWHCIGVGGIFKMHLVPQAPGHKQRGLTPWQRNKRHHDRSA